MTKKNKVLFFIIMLLGAMVTILMLGELLLDLNKEKNEDKEKTEKKSYQNSQISDNYNNPENKSPDKTNKNIIKKEEKKNIEDNTTVKENKNTLEPKDSDKKNLIKKLSTEVNSNMVLINFSLESALINKTHKLPEGYVPTDLQVPDIPARTYTHENKQMRKKPAESLEKLFEDAAKEGINLFIISGFRSYDLQKSIYDSSVSSIGLEETQKLIAIPGSSEHQSGLSVDISCESENFDLNESLGDKPEGIWLAENAHKYGFIIRYPKGKEHITKISYEPWHLRYVGIEISKEIYEKKICLEEYFESD